MDVRIAQPLGYSELGGRSNNEDSIFPDPQYTSPRQKWFLVCDGVGGAERGEVASHLAVNTLNAFLEQHPAAVPADEYIQQAVAYVEDQFNAYFEGTPTALGMATTMTMLYLHEAGATVAHIGDSRVYHIRDGLVIWRTDDHSYVNELVRAGVLTPAEAHRHPKRNIITRALQGGEKRIHASVQLINDLRPGDYFFLCSDGVLERVSDELLEGTLRNPADSNEQKIAKLRAYSSGNTRDNFTAYLIQIEQVMGTVDSAYKVAPPVYERFQMDTDPDEAVTLINMPVPEPIREELVQTPIEQETYSSLRMPEARVTPTPLPTTPARRTNPVQDRVSERPTAPLPARRSISPWTVMLFVSMGALAVVGGFLASKYINNKPATAEQPTKAADSSAATPTEKPHRGNLVEAAISSMPSPSTQATGQSKTEAVATGESSSTVAKVGVSHTNGTVIGSDSPKKLTDASATAGYEIVQKVDAQLAVCKDHKTNLMGLQKNGRWTTDPIYSRIDRFEKGIARVESSTGSARFLNTDGKEFDDMKGPSNGKIAVQQGKRWGYLNSEEGRISIKIQYDKAASFTQDGTALVMLNGETIRIDKNGHKVVSKGEMKSADKKTEVKKGQGHS